MFFDIDPISSVITLSDFFDEKNSVFYPLNRFSLPEESAKCY